jgi:acyl-coenzyme A synthetase/AMP-(fatty) acid ligase
MYLLGTHRSITQRLRLTLNRNLGAGNFFWNACAIADDLDRPILFHARTAQAEPDRYSLADLRARAVSYADWYSGHGVRAGSRVGIYVADGLQVLLHHIALTSIGAVNVLANPRLVADAAVQYFRGCEVRTLVADGDRLTACTEAGIDVFRRVADDEFRQLPPTGTTRPRRAHRHRYGDLVMISHSSGTTGAPKPTTFTHGGFFIGKRERLWKFPSRRTDRLLSALPYSHSAGLSYLSLALMIGLPTLLIDDTSGTGVAAGIVRFRPTVVLGFPLSLAELAAHMTAPTEARERVPEGFAAAAGDIHTWMGMGDASHERHIRPLVALGRRTHRQHTVPGSAYVDGLGSSEMGMVLFRCVHTPETNRYGRLIGKPVPVVREAVVLDESGNGLPDGRAGLLGVCTPSVTPGYWNEPELNRTSRRGEYFLTGDVVRRDADGNFYHLDRTPDVIVTADGPVYSLPLEEVVLNTTGALDAAVVGVDDPDRPDTSRPIAVVLFGKADPPSAEDLLARCNDALDRAGLNRIRALVIAAGRSELPVGVTGKVLKRVLRERHRNVLLLAGATADVAVTGG